MNQPGAIPSVDVLEANRRLEGNERALVVDVREPNEFSVVRLPGSALFPLSTFALRHGDIPRDRPILVLCAAGSRSLAATAHLLRSGWTDVVNVAGGIDAWQRAGLPTRSGPIDPGEGDLPSG